MARKPSTLKDISVKSNLTERPDVNIICTKCGKEKSAKTDFYISYDSKISTAPFCKECVIKNSLTEDGSSVDIDRFQNVLQQLGRPYLHQIYINNVKKNGTTPTRIVGDYMKDISMKQYRPLNWQHSDFGHIDEEKVNNIEIESVKPKKQKKEQKISIKEREQLVDKWGEYTDKELVRFEKKYQQMSKSYQISTTLHEEGLIDYCRLQCLYEIAVEQKNVQEAKLFKSLADEAKKNAKLNPLQLSAKDMATGGASSFGEIARVVSKKNGVLALPLKYVKQPNDRIDYAIYQFVSYERALRGLSEPTYEDIYEWYIKDVNEYEKTHGVKFDDEPRFIEG